MADLLGTGISGLLASRLALDTTGHNIANVNTPGYSRQRVDLVARPPQPVGTYFVGQGVDAVGVERSYSQYLTTALWNQGASLKHAGTFNQLTSELNNMFAGSSNLQAALDSFYAGVQDAANHPTSTPTRQALLGKATSLVATFHTLDNQLGRQWARVNQRIGDSVADVNSLASGIAQLNEQIAKQTVSGNAPNDLLDHRDELLRQLSEKIQLTTSTQGNRVNVFIGNGQALVDGGNAHTLQTAANPYDATRTEVIASTGASLSSQIGGGSLGGLLDYRNTVLEPTRQRLDRAATAFASAFNAQHHQGMDLHGQLGGDVFSVPAARALPATGNGSSAQVTVTRADISALADHAYTLRYNGSAWTLAASGGAPVSMSGSGTTADPFVIDGLELAVGGGAPAAGDSFRIEPVRSAAGSIQLMLSDPAQLALAAPVKTIATSGNQSSVAALDVTDIGNANLLDTVAIEFTDANSYSINGAGSFSYTPGTPIQVNGWSLALDGTPKAGDHFDVRANTDGAGDNRNALALGEVADRGVLDGGSTSVGEAYASMVAANGTIGARAQVSLDAQTSLYQQAAQSQQSLAGVSLEEEAGNLIRYQQSYQAAAQVISAANTIFDTLINAVRS